MRLYKIILSKNNLTSFLSMFSDIQNPNGITIKQNNGGYKDNIGMELESSSYAQKGQQFFSNTTLTLYNINRYWQNQGSSGVLKEAKVDIYGGTLATPIQYRQGLVDISNTCYLLNERQLDSTPPIYSGYIMNSYASMDGQTNLLIINLSPNNTVKEESLVKKGVFPQLNIEAGVSWRERIQTYILDYLSTTQQLLKVKICPPSKDSVVLTEDTLNTENITSIFEDTSGGISLQKIIEKKYKESISIYNSTIYIGTPVDLPIAVISDKDILGQPQLIQARTIQLRVPLTSKFCLNQKVILNIESFIGYSQFYPTQADPSNVGLSINRINKYFTGTYNIIQILHTMRSQDTGIDSWCTTLTLTEVI